MIIVLDTNVVVSGILKPSSPAAAILRLVADGAIQLAYDLRFLQEYREVLGREKFHFSKESATIFLSQIGQEGFMISARPISFRLPDPDDLPFLEVALSTTATGIVTGNKRYFPRRQYGGVRIFSPVEFLESYRKLHSLGRSKIIR